MPEPRPVTTASRAAMTRTIEAPPVLVPVVKAPEVAPQADLAVYVTNQSREAQFKIVAIEGDEEDMALTRAVLAHHVNGVIQFTNYHFSTPHVSVAQWLDKRIYSGMIRGVARDTGDLVMRCKYCDFEVKNNPAGIADLNRHRVDEHAALIYGGALFGEELDA